ncbi:unnamed protein product [Arabis nemorensis]|uniref:Myb/SANT-like domain-containing protein n=1 Tax=Arabis nemorensis TaxID=586526 RepID=A0A565BVA8_9BRAS|nr:unnamed protein product [Arabis nemorensis]
MTTRNSGKEQPKWTAFLTKLLANLIVDQVLKGNRVNNSFSNKAWNFISDEFYKRSGFKWDKEHLKNRFAVLRRQYGVVKLLLARDDFVFDESNGFIIANDEAWDQYVTECPDAEGIRTDGCPIYKQLSQIFAEESMSNGKHETTRPYFTRLKEPVLLPQTEAELSSEYDDAAAVCPPTLKRKRRSRGMEAAIANAIFEMADASKLRTTALTQLRSRFSLAECIRELDRIQGVAENVYFAALEFFNNPSARETFLSLKRDLRLPWLQWKCNVLTSLSINVHESEALNLSSNDSMKSL